MRENIAMQCSECSSKNYMTNKEMKGTPKLERNKYCKFCKKHTKHNEKKKS
ncbi:MAG: 50S ribosomal protein L33 [Planctomycetota bacterium]|jgi:large subunit ribosomal protein L33